MDSGACRSPGAGLAPACEPAATWTPRHGMPLQRAGRGLAASSAGRGRSGGGESDALRRWRERRQQDGDECVTMLHVRPGASEIRQSHGLPFV